MNQATTTIDCISPDGESTVIYGEFNNIPDACHFARLVYQFDKFLTECEREVPNFSEGELGMKANLEDTPKNLC